MLYTAARKTWGYRIAVQDVSLFKGGMHGVSANGRRHNSGVKPFQTLKNVCSRSLGLCKLPLHAGMFGAAGRSSLP